MNMSPKEELSLIFKKLKINKLVRAVDIILKFYVQKSSIDDTLSP